MARTAQIVQRDEAQATDMGYYKKYAGHLSAAQDKYSRASELFESDRFNAERASLLLEEASSSIPTKTEFDLAKKAAPFRMAFRSRELRDLRRNVDNLKLRVFQEIFYDPDFGAHGKPDRD